MNGWFVLLVAISISAVAAYYSIVGLAAIFTGAVIPVIIMASVLEVGKLVSAVWLHQNWNTIHFLMKTYFTSAVIILMFITSMGIFGFLSRAHIEHSGSSTQLIATVENINQELQRIENTIQTRSDQISNLRSRDANTFSTIQDQIDQEQANIDRIYARIQPDIDRLELALQAALSRKETIQSSFAILNSSDIRAIQSLVGVPSDGQLGPQTRSAIELYRERANADLVTLDGTISEQTARISELRQSVEPLVQESNALINQLRSRITFSDDTLVQEQITNLETEIIELEIQSRILVAEKFDLETQLRLYEVEIGPIKYIAEFVYGNSDVELIEEAVRWVIFLIIFVFDPLAVLLVLAAVSTINKNKKPNNEEERTHVFSQKEIDTISKTYFEGIPQQYQPEMQTDDESNVAEKKPKSRNIRYFKKFLFGGS
jgi:peptidoglycan hydrolase-like protein with peptidoglycan-binding domain